MNTEEKTKQMKKIRDDVINCKDCPLYKERIANNYRPVIGEGSHDTRIMFVGEAPGREEARTGRPFCGRAGKILDELLEGVGIKRESVYIANILKDRPPGNRDPSPEEILAYTPFLERQIETIEPEVLSPLGRVSMRFLMEKFGLKDQIEPISKIHGKVFEVQSLFQSMKIIPLYHPAVATYNPNMRGVLKEDFEILKKFK